MPQFDPTPMNTLRRHLDETGDNVSRLAERIGRSVSTITRPMKGKRDVSVRIAEEIQRATDGRVTAEQFVADCMSARRAWLAQQAVTEPRAAA